MALNMKQTYATCKSLFLEESRAVAKLPFCATKVIHLTADPMAKIQALDSKQVGLRVLNLAMGQKYYTTNSSRGIGSIEIKICLGTVYNF